ncbi:hypothetical protein G6F32_014875 [Rhizopus arrhizus]|nr:hypothetical protein G6F32_014875 [Rhizopus arrhizus]
MPTCAPDSHLFSIGRHHRQVAEQVEVTAVEVVLQVGGQAVEVQGVGEQRIAGPERIAEAATAHRHPVRRAVGQPGLVQPHILLAQAAAQLFGGRHRAITAAAGQAHAGGGVLADGRFDAQAGTDAPQVAAVLAAVQQRRQLQVGVGVE